MQMFNSLSAIWHQKMAKASLFQALKTALVVGSLITFINQYDGLIAQEPFYPVRAILSYCVPFFVFLYSRLSAADSD